MFPVLRLLKAFLWDENGQDLVEYAYLTLFIGLAGLAAWLGIVDAMGTAYAGFDSGTQELWEPPDPTSGS